MQLILLLGTYLLAGIPFGYLIGRARGIDVRQHGSGNIGATNVLRSGGRAAAVATLLLDLGKGAIPVMAARSLFPGEDRVAVSAAFVAVLGHCFPVYLRFRGGKGVATGLGAFLVLLPWAAASSFGVFAVIVLFTRLVALGSTLGTLSFPVFAWLLGAPVVAVGSLPTALLIVWRHRANLRRIRAGTEDRLGARRSPVEGS